MWNIFCDKMNTIFIHWFWLSSTLLLTAIAQNPSILEDARVHPTSDGSFGFLYRTQDGIAHAAKGDPGGAVHGRFTYTDPTGLKVNFNYNAGAQAIKEKQQQTQPQYEQPQFQQYQPQTQQTQYMPRPQPIDNRYTQARYQEEYVQPHYEPQHQRYEAYRPQPQYRPRAPVRNDIYDYEYDNNQGY